MRKVLYQKVFVTVLALLALASMAIYVFGNKNFSKFKRIEQDVERLTNSNKQLIQNKHRLQRHIKGFRYNTRYLEHLAWEELDLIREGDQVFRFPKSPDKQRLTR